MDTVEETDQEVYGVAAVDRLRLTIINLSLHDAAVALLAMDRDRRLIDTMKKSAARRETDVLDGNNKR